MRRGALLAILLALPAGVLAHELLSSSGTAVPTAAQGTDPGTTTGAHTTGSPERPVARVPVVARVGTLPAPVQDPAVAALGGRVYAFGGLDGAQASVASVTTFASAGARTGGQLPVAIHDAAAAAVNGRLYVFGGGQTQSYAGIGRFDPSSGRTRLVGSLPTPLSDLAVATIGATAYIVGGYTGAVFSDRIVAFSGGHARTVGRLPTGLRYAAVAALGGKLVIAGGRTTSGPSAAVYRFDPATGAVTRIGRLPAAVMHASAGVLGGTMYVVGGIRTTGPTAAVVAVSPAGRTRVAARLPQPLSDAGVVTQPGRLLVVGGSDGTAPVASILSITLRPRPGAASTPAPKRRRAASGGPPKPFRGPLPGDLLIADRGNNRILMVNPAGRILWRYPNRAGQRHLYFDDDTFFGDHGRRIISNQEEDHSIVEISYPAGRIVWEYGHPGVRGSAPGYLNTPDDAYLLRNGLVIVADAYNCRVLEIRGHRVVRSIGNGVCAHNPPTSLGAVNGDTPLPGGHILVSEINGSYIDEFTLGGRLVRVYHAPVSYPSDPQLTRNGNIILADYSRPGGVVILSRRTGAVLWSYRPPAGPGMLDHPSLAAMLPNGDVIVGDDFNDRIVVIDPHTNRIVWQYGHTAVGGTAPGYLHIPDGFDFVPVTSTGKPDPAAIVHGP
jgi:outer membrane protein assembly factor BamB